MVMQFSRTGDVSASCDMRSSVYIFSAMSQLLTMMGNTMAVLFLFYRDLKPLFVALIYISIAVIHFLLLGPLYLFRATCGVSELSPFVLSIFEWNRSTGAISAFLLYIYDTFCVGLITISLYSADQNFKAVEKKRAEQRKTEPVKRTLLDLGAILTILAQVSMLVIKVLSVVFVPSSDRGMNALDSASNLLLILHACLCSYSYNHYLAIFRKASRKAPGPKGIVKGSNEQVKAKPP
jgi:hypothetical protein